MSTITTSGRVTPRTHESEIGAAWPLGVAATTLTIGSFLAFSGLSWDVEWHNNVGPDTFFTLPHLVLYSGMALGGLSCLFAALWHAWSQRSARGLNVPALLGAAWGAPVGFVISGLGAATFLAFGFFDLWWHTIYGFDVTFESPPHIGLLLGVQIMMIGSITVFAQRVLRAQVRRAWAWPVIGLAAATAISLGGSLPFQTIVPPFLLIFAGYKLTAALIYVAALLMVASVVRQPGAATMLGLLFVLVRAITWAFTMWATPVYAASLDLFMRDNINSFPGLPDMMPPALLLAGVLVDLSLAVARRRGMAVRPAVLITGALAGLLMAWLYQPQAFSAPEILPYIAQMLPPTLILAPAVGALAGWLGWQLGILLRSSAD